jgi:hypothetical protein
MGSIDGDSGFDGHTKYDIERYGCLIMAEELWVTSDMDSSRSILIYWRELLSPTPHIGKAPGA